MNEEAKNSTIEPELEARIVALVLGESSDFETEELNRLIALRPELAAFQQEMQQVHELMGAVAASRRTLVPFQTSIDEISSCGRDVRAPGARTSRPHEPRETPEASFRLMETPDANWKLSADRRASVLAVIRGEAATLEDGASLADVDTGNVAFRAESPTRTLPGASAPGIENLISAGPEGRNNIGVDPSGLANAVSDHRWLTPPAEDVPAHSGLNAASTGLARRLRTMLTDSLSPLASSVRRGMRKTPMKIAAGICVAGFIGLLTVPSFFREESMLADSSNHWSFSVDRSELREDVTSRSFRWSRADERHSLSGGTELSFQVAPQTSSGSEVAGGELHEQLITQLDSANADNAGGSAKALSTLQQTLNGGGLAANETNHVYSSRWRAVVPPSSAPEAWFGQPLAERFGDEGRSSSMEYDYSVPLAAPEDVKFSKSPATWDENAPNAAEYKNGLGSGAAEGLPNVMSIAPLLAGTLERPASPEPVTLSDVSEESIPKLMIKSEEESVGKSPGLELTDSEKTLEDMQASSDQHPFASNPKSDDVAPTDKSRPVIDGRSDGEQMGKELQKSEALRLNGTASDFGTTAPGLSELSDEVGVIRRQVVPGRPGSGSQPESTRGRRMKSSEDSGRLSGEETLVKPAEAKSEAPDADGDELFDVEMTVRESREKSDSEKKESAKLFDEPIEALILAEEENRGYRRGFQFHLDPIEMDRLQSLAESKSKDATPSESDFDSDISKDLGALSKGNANKERVEEWRKPASEPASAAKGLNNVFSRENEASLPSVAGRFLQEKKSAGKPVAPSAGLNETNAAAEAFSTFSLHVSDVSFKLAASALARGEWPEAARIRIEEFVNAFDYGDPLPGKGEKVACAVEQGIHPFLQQRNVLRVSMRTSAEGRATNTPLRLTFVLDNSGSMERIDRQQTVRRAFTLLSKQLTAIDQVTLISFSRQPRLLAENVSGTESGQLVELMEQLPSEGGTNIEAALQLAFEKASAQQTPGAQNRIVLLTDGAVNMGNANPESLSQMVESMRAAGIAFDAAGISADGLNDEVLEALTRKGDGRYYLMDSGEADVSRFAQQIAGALRPSASNVKVQVEFNPKRVGQYKLLGFEKHLLKQEDFRNDAVDAAEMAAAEAGVAMYQFEAKPDGEGDVGSVSVRFRDLSTGEMVEHRWPIPYEPEAARPDQATPSLRIATTAAMLAAKLKGEALGESVDLQTLSQLIDSLPSQHQSQTRVQQLKLMIEQARQMSAK